jgi:uroporphyrinogen decarboxylase
LTWSHRERLLAALHHEEPDRVPIDFGSALATTIILDAYEDLKHHLGMSHETGVMSKTSKLTHPHEEVLHRFDVDTRGVQLGSYVGGHKKVPDENSFIDEFDVLWKISPGGKDVHYLHKDGPFHNTEASIDLIESFDWPDPDNPGLVEGVRERVEAIKQLGDYALVLELPGGVVHRGYAMRGFEQYLKDLYKHPEFVTRLMDKLAEYWIRCAENVIAVAGPENIDVVFFGEDLGTQDGCMFDPAIYEKLIKPRHRRVIETVKSLTDAKLLFHCCGSAYHFIDHLIDMGVDALNPVQVTARNMEPERLKAEFGDRISFWGGINTQRLLPYGTPAEVTAETRRVIDILGRGGGYVVNSVHNIQPGVPPENIVAMFDEARNHGYDKAA